MSVMKVTCVTPVMSVMKVYHAITGDTSDVHHAHQRAGVTEVPLAADAPCVTYNSTGTYRGSRTWTGWWLTPCWRYCVRHTADLRPETVVLSLALGAADTGPAAG